MSPLCHIIGQTCLITNLVRASEQKKPDVFILNIYVRKTVFCILEYIILYIIICDVAYTYAPYIHVTVPSMGENVALELCRVLQLVHEGSGVVRHQLSMSPPHLFITDPPPHPDSLLWREDVFYFKRCL